MRPLGRNVERYHEAVHGMTDLVQGRRRARLLGRLDDRAPLPLRGLRGRPEPGRAERLLGGGHEERARRPARLHDERAEPDPRGGGDRDPRPPHERALLRRLLARLPGALDQRPRPAPRHRARRCRRRAARRRTARRWTRPSSPPRTRTTASTATSSRSRSTSSSSPGRPTASSARPAAAGRSRTRTTEGIEWGMKDATARHGAPGEIGDDGRVHRVSVVPAPYSDPHPPVFVASNASQGDRRVLRRQGLRPDVLLGHRAGRQVRPGLRRARAGRRAATSRSARTRRSCAGCRSPTPRRRRAARSPTTTPRST